MPARPLSGLLHDHSRNFWGFAIGASLAIVILLACLFPLVFLPLQKNEENIDNGPNEIDFSGYPNCEQLNPNLQVRWAVSNGMLSVELTGLLMDDEATDDISDYYMAFGRSGRDEETYMMGSDVIIADFYGGEARAIDYYMIGRHTCVDAAGVCPDKVSGLDDAAMDASGELGPDGTSVLRFRRPLVPVDKSEMVGGRPADRPISVLDGEKTFVSWAMGRINPATGLPLFHKYFPRTSVSIEFGRAGVDNCVPLSTTPAPTVPNGNLPPATNKTSPEPTTAPSTLAPTTMAPTSLESMFFCPEPGSVLSVPDGLISLAVSTPLCTLMLRKASGDILHVGRSYASRKWENMPGMFSDSVEYECPEEGADDEVVCRATLPTVEEGDQYELESFVDPTYSSEELHARFLQQATFGVTKDDIADLEAREASRDIERYASWMKDQMGVKPTSHRSFYRTHVLARFESPARQGLVTGPCQKGTRYRLFAFAEKDSGRVVELATDPATGDRIMRLAGSVRTVVVSIATRQGDEWPDGFHQICRRNQFSYVDENLKENSRVALLFPEQGCQDMYVDGKKGNTYVNFTEATLPDRLINLDDVDGVKPHASDLFSFRQPPVQELMLTEDVDLPECQGFGITGLPDNPVFATYKGYYWIHDPRFVLLRNTRGDPLPDAGGTQMEATRALTDNDEINVMCSNVARSFLNEDTCIVSNAENVCQDEVLNDFVIELNHDIISTIYDATRRDNEDNARYLYAVDGLRLERDDDSVAPPCRPGATSRWVKSDCSQDPDEKVADSTSSTLEALMRENEDPNPFVTDIFMPMSGTHCSIDDRSRKGFLIKGPGGSCYRNVHPDHLQVYDMTYWTESMAHPGNTAEWNPIKEPHQKGDSILQYPDNHSMQRWANEKKRLENVGRLGDSVDFNDLPEALTSQQVATALGSIEIPGSSSVVVCGSPNEISNDLSLEGNFRFGAFGLYSRFNKTATGDEFVMQKKQVWNTVVMNAPDQLRQRVAWALSQILVIAPGMLYARFNTEANTNFYDIFVRHAFGNYRDILKEVSFAPLMGEMLTFIDSRSTAAVWWETQRSQLQFPDENYAREIMQLFSIGLYKLRESGIKILDEDGNPIKTYTNSDIEEYARVWTGFRRRGGRGNVEVDDGVKTNRFDPMNIYAFWRDKFPKMGLDRRYIGDGYPLCVDLPEKHFLKAGAKYRRVGSNGRPELQLDPKRWGTTEVAKRMKVDTGGPLFDALCHEVVDGQCKFPVKVILQSDLNCSGIECYVDTVRTVEVEKGIFYEYIRPPCVHQAFFENGRKVVDSNYYQGQLVCADPREEVANAACCLPYPGCGGDCFPAEITDGAYWGERVRFATAEQRCTENPMCKFPYLRGFCRHQNSDSDNMCSNNPREATHFWTTAPCNVQAKVHEDGRVAIVHAFESLGPSHIMDHVREDTKTIFRVDWATSDYDGVPPTSDILREVEKVCTPSVDGAYLCNVVVEDKNVYNGTEGPSSVNEMLFELDIGAFSPSFLNSYEHNDMKVHNPPSTPQQFTADSVFEATDHNGVTHFRKNVKSVVKLKGTQLSFRNPVHFVGLVDSDPRDTFHETDAAIDHFFYHQNIAPFLALRFAQRFGHSNPSPRYVQQIATAFRSGSYEMDGISFGSGHYGDLASTVAAVLLDPEARSQSLDHDPGHGALLEPFLKLIAVMRSLQYEPAKFLPLITFGPILQDLIGQGPYEVRSVFSYFLPEFVASGSRGAATGLVMPEAQAMSSPKIIATMNGIYSLLRWGLEQCYGGYGLIPGGKNDWCNADRNWVGTLKYVPASDDPDFIINELSSLLTAGRLSKANREIAKNALHSLSNPSDGLVKAQQLIISSAEFHSTGIVEATGGERPPLPSPNPKGDDYRAVVFVMLEGGYDSWNMLVPHECDGTNEQGKNVRQQYEEERGVLAFLEKERQIFVNLDSDRQTLSQPCSKFAIHDELTFVAELFADGDLSFFANAGALTRPSTKANYYEQSATQLFAHNAMQKEAMRVDPLEESPDTGILGRTLDVLAGKGFETGSLSIDDPSVSVRGVPGEAADPVIVSRTGATTFNPAAHDKEDEWYVDDDVEEINGATKPTSNVYGEFWSGGLHDAMGETEAISVALEKTPLSNRLPARPAPDEEVMAMAARLIKSRKVRGVDRDVVHVTLGRWDHHKRTKTVLRSRFQEFNAAMSFFVNEAKTDKTWEDTTVVVVSDFGRTLSPNSGGGSDHAWGGHYMILGGAVDGGRIHGQYPYDITKNGKWNIGGGRGRMIPALSWESMWNGVAQWMGAETEADLDEIMPNRKTTGTTLFNQTDLFEVKGRRLLRRNA